MFSCLKASMHISSKQIFTPAAKQKPTALARSIVII